MPKRLADVIEEHLKESGPLVSVRNGDTLNERKHAEEIEAKLQAEFVILPKKLFGKK